MRATVVIRYGRSRIVRDIQLLARLLCPGFLLLAALVFAPPAWPESPPAASGSATSPRIAATILDLYPARDAQLKTGQTFYVHYRIDANAVAALTVRLQAFDRGRDVPVANSGIGLLPPGGGTDAAYVFVQDKLSVHVDELRLVVSQLGREQPVASVPVAVDLTWSSDAAATVEPLPDWVRQWAAERSARQKEAYQKTMAQSSASRTIFTLLLGPALAAMILASIGIPLWAAWTWRGRWRIAALPALIVLGIVALRIIIDTHRDPTSHNLWPLEILIWNLPCLLYLGVVWLLRRRARSTAA